MPVTIVPAPHKASPSKLNPKDSFATSAVDLLTRSIQRTVPNKVNDGGKIEVFQSSLDTAFQRAEGHDSNDKIYSPSNNNGFLAACISAYNNHHHLSIRPDDVWIAIITQLSIYVNANAESLRSHFVSHAERKTLVVEYSLDQNRYNINFGDFAKTMTGLLAENIHDPELREWILPGFSTSTDCDFVVASVTMMATLQRYFTYVCTSFCGIPSVTLHGERQDYELILNRIDKLEDFGEQASQFARLLRPILRNFLASFDNPKSGDVISFWNRIYSYQDLGSGTPYFSGWITAFAFWNNDGRVLWDYRFGTEKAVEYHRNPLNKSQYLVLDDVVYHHVDDGSEPSGMCKVPVKILDTFGEIDAWMVAGSVGVSYGSEGSDYTNTQGAYGRVLDRVSPLNGWYMFTGGYLTEE